VQSLLAEDHGVELSKETIQQIAYDAGEMVVKHQAAKRAAFFGLSPAEQPNAWPPAQCSQPPRVVAVYGDGTRMPTEGEWREIRVGRVLAWDGQKRRIGQQTFARFLSVEEFGQQLAMGADSWNPPARASSGRGASCRACATGSVATPRRSLRCVRRSKTAVSMTSGRPISAKPPNLATANRPHPGLSACLPLAPQHG
jgi:hypothetical protein